MKNKNSYIYLVIIESLLAAGIIGLHISSLVWGIAAFFAIIILYAIPVLRGVLSIVNSVAEASIIYKILLRLLPVPITWGMTLLVLYILMMVHRNLIVRNIKEDREKFFGFSLVITESLMLSSIVGYSQKSIPITCILFIVLIALAFIPILQIIGLLILTFSIAWIMWELTKNAMEMNYSVPLVLIVFLYTGLYHIRICLQSQKTQDKNHNPPQSNTVQKNTKHAVSNNNYYKESYYLCTHTDYEDMTKDEGKYGEYLIYEELKHYEQSNAKFLFNCYINKKDNSTTELDVMLICHGGIFVFESKNYSGWIFGDESSLNWTQILPAGNGQSKKTQFYNPVKQNNTHIKCLKNLIDSSIPIYSIIVFSDKCTLKDVKTYSENIYVIQCKELKRVVNMLAKRTKHSLDTKQISELYKKLYPFTQVSDKVKEMHIEDIEKRLITPSQKHTANQNKKNDLRLLICPQCGSRLVLRMAGKGEDIGKSFYGCSAFPKCRYTREIKKMKSAK